MKVKQFKQLYNLLMEQKQKDTFIVQFTIQDVEFLFFKNEKNYICKFNFTFLEEPQQVTVELKPDNKIKFIIDDVKEDEEEYTRDQFKQYFNYHYQLFLEAVKKFKEFITNKQKIKEEQNTLKIIPLEKVLNQTSSQNSIITMDGVDFNFTELKNSFNDVFKVTFSLTQDQTFPVQKNAIAVVKNLFSQNYFILKMFLSNTENEKEIENEDDVIELTKDQFAQKYVLYFDKLNKAIKAYLNIH